MTVLQEVGNTMHDQRKQPLLLVHAHNSCNSRLRQLRLMRVDLFVVGAWGWQGPAGTQQGLVALLQHLRHVPGETLLLWTQQRSLLCCTAKMSLHLAAGVRRWGSCRLMAGSMLVVAGL